MTSPLVVLDPKKEVHFPGPYNKRFTAKLMIENVSQHKVAFRLMTLEPRHYIVDPSKGIIPAHQSTTVNIVLKTIENEANFKTATQKFLVQVVPAKPDSTSDSVSELFSKALTGDINYFKLIAVFDNLGKPPPAANADYVTCSEPSSSSAASSSGASKTSTGSFSSSSSSSSSSAKAQPSFGKFSPSKTGAGEKQRFAEKLPKTNSTPGLVVENGSLGEYNSVKGNEATEVVPSGKSVEGDVKAAPAPPPAKQATPAKKLIGEPVESKSISKNSISKSSVNSKNSKNSNNNPNNPNDKGECPYMSSYKYLAIAAGIVLLGAIIYRQVTRGGGGSCSSCAGGQP